MGSEVSLQTIKEDIADKSMEYFKTTGESYGREFLLLLVDSLADEYKGKRNYPEYFTEEQVDADTADYFKHKVAFFSMNVIPAMTGKIGAEGQSAHSENGISRTWEKGNWFNDVVPYCEVV